MGYLGWKQCYNYLLFFFCKIFIAEYKKADRNVMNGI